MGLIGRLSPKLAIGTIARKIFNHARILGLQLRDRGFRKRHFASRSVTSTAFVWEMRNVLGGGYVRKTWSDHFSRMGCSVISGTGRRTEALHQLNNLSSKPNIIVLIGHGDTMSFADGFDVRALSTYAPNEGFDALVLQSCFSKNAYSHIEGTSFEPRMHKDGIVLTYAGFGTPAASMDISIRYMEWWWHKAPPTEAGYNSEVMTDWIYHVALFWNIFGAGFYKFVHPNIFPDSSLEEIR